MGNAVVILLLAAIITLIVRKLVRDRRAGRSCCGHRCSCCPMAGQCDAKTKQNAD